MATPSKEPAAEKAEKPARKSTDVRGKLERKATEPASFGSYFASCMRTDQARSQDRSTVGLGEALAKVIGIPFGHLSLEYLFESNVIALERLMQIRGKEGTFKSALAFWFTRRFREYRGGTVLVETESKFSPDQAASIIGWEALNALQVEQTDDLDDAQRKLTYHINKMKSDMTGWKPKPKKSKMRKPAAPVDEGKKPKGIGRKFPVLYLLDSLAGRVSEETTRKIDEVGAAERDYSNEALALTKYLKRLAGAMNGYPYFFIATNHLKLDKNPNGSVVRRAPGGVQINFGQTYELEMTRVQEKADIHLSKNPKIGERYTTHLKIECRKNSLGTTYRNILVDVCWENRRDENDNIVQHTWFDWDAATMTLLMSLPATTLEQVKEVFHFDQVAGKRYWSRTLKVPKDAPISASEMGARLQQHPEIIKELRKILGIKLRRVFNPDVDYGKQLAEATAEIYQELAKQ